jgi:hypothetical protein
VRRVWIGAGVLSALAFATFVWPTPYRYHEAGPDLWRENRFTHALDWASPNGWEPQRPAPKPVTDADIERMFADK